MPLTISPPGRSTNEWCKQFPALAVAVAVCVALLVAGCRQEAPSNSNSELPNSGSPNSTAPVTNSTVGPNSVAPAANSAVPPKHNPSGRPAIDVGASTRNLSAEERTNTELFKQASTSIVHITTSEVRRDFFSLNLLEIPQGSGTGFVWDDAGHIVTNYHVIKDADVAHVSLADHSNQTAKLVGVAPDKDLAVIKIDAPSDKLRPISVGRSDDLQVGLKVFAIGNPFGLDQTLTTGIISALGREIESVTRRPIKDMIQTDAAINPGNSGGPLLDSQGHLIGVNTAIYSPSGAYAGIGFAIPVDTVKRVVPQLIQHGKLIRPGLAIGLADDGVARRFDLPGVLILHVLSDSTAAKAGLRATRRNRFGEVLLGDIVVAVNGKPVKTTNDLWLAFEQFQIGQTVTLTVIRDDEKQTVDVQLEAVD